MRTVVFDGEMDNLIDSFKTGEYQTVSKIWCISTIEIETGERNHFGPDDIDSGLEYIGSADVAVGHNIIEYDFRVFRMLKDFIFTGKVIDTLVLSRYLYPERAGGHGIEAWGVRVGKAKPSHEDWSQYTPEMKTRCDEDTEINLLTYHMLMEESREPIEGVYLYE
jgi:hypothetical protein